jgi:hypothetical protein
MASPDNKDSQALISIALTFSDSDVLGFACVGFAGAANRPVEMTKTAAIDANPRKNRPTEPLHHSTPCLEREELVPQSIDVHENTSTCEISQIFRDELLLG